MNNDSGGTVRMLDTFIGTAWVLPVLVLKKGKGGRKQWLVL